jgi:hypothetical protein
MQQGFETLFFSHFCQSVRSEPLFLGVADYGYDFNFIEDFKTYTHRTFNTFKIAFSYLDPATPIFATFPRRTHVILIL